MAVAEQTTVVPASRPQVWKPVGAAALSILLPGAGHLLMGRRRRAIVFFAVDGAILLFGLWLLARGTIGLLELLVQPRWVRAVIAGNLVLALWRVVAVVDVLALDRPRVPVYAASGVAAVLLVVLIAPHVFVMTRAVALLGVLENVFPDQGHVAAAFDQQRLRAAAERAAGAMGPDTTVTGTTVPGLFPDSPDGVITPRVRNDSRPELEDIDFHRVTVLLAGGDAGPGRSGLRTDTMIIASLDSRTGQGVLITISRELVQVPLAPKLRQYLGLAERQDLIFEAAKKAEEGGYSHATDPEPEERDESLWLDRINALYPFTRTFERTYPNEVRPGMAALAETLGYALGLPIDYYVLVDMAGFVDLVNAIGGVRVTSMESMNIRMSPAKEGEEDYTLEIGRGGTYYFNGREALVYVRNRTDTSDLVRTRRQRCFVRQVVGQIDPATVVLRFDRLASAVERHARTNIPIYILPKLIRLVAEVDTANIGSMAIEPGYYANKLDYRGLPVFNTERARAGVRDVINGIESGAPVVDGSECPG